VELVTATIPSETCKSLGAQEHGFASVASAFPLCIVWHTRIVDA
jgi:hypothetical protein